MPTNEHPILFSGEMVRAILDGRKTQTRRIIKPQPEKILPQEGWYELCPYGKVSDRLWVRENIRTLCYEGRTDFEYGSFLIEYIADGKIIRCPDKNEGWWRHNWHIRPATTISSRFMPKWATRIWLEITGIRVERVQEISGENAQKEGWPRDQELYPMMNTGHKAKRWFRFLWDSLNTERGFGWNVNPYVWVISFRKQVKDEI